MICTLTLQRWYNGTHEKIKRIAEWKYCEIPYKLRTHKGITFTSYISIYSMQQHCTLSVDSIDRTGCSNGYKNRKEENDIVNELSTYTHGCTVTSTVEKRLNCIMCCIGLAAKLNSIENCCYIHVWQSRLSSSTSRVYYNERVCILLCIQAAVWHKRWRSRNIKKARCSVWELYVYICVCIGCCCCYLF